MKPTDEQKAARKEASRTLSALREVMPVPFPVRLRWIKQTPRTRAWSSVATNKVTGKRSAYLHLPDEAPLELLTELVVHEYAHLLATDYYGTDNDAVWAVAYKDCYGVIYGSH